MACSVGVATLSSDDQALAPDQLLTTLACCLQTFMYQYNYILHPMADVEEQSSLAWLLLLPLLR